ncbi:MAG: MerC domain-containing protein [Pirellulaceae bacterium]
MNALPATSEPVFGAPPSSTWADRAGMVASIGCAIHCAAMPLVLAYLPALGLTWLSDEGFHKWMAAICFGLAAAAFVPGWRKHRSFLPAIWGATVVGALPSSVVQPHHQVVADSHHQHRHLHFGDTLAESKQFRLSDAPIPFWRWPFVLGIGALACHAIAIRTRKEKQDAKASQPVQPSIVRSVGLATTDGQGGKV